MHLEFLVEETSAEAALQILLPKILPGGVTSRIHSYQGKQDLLDKLKQRLRGYRTSIPQDWRIVVLVDADGENCRELKRRLEQAARDSGFVTRLCRRASFQVVNRLAVEELEAWFFGDLEALVAAYPGVPRTLGKRRDYRDPDAIRGGTWEALERVLQRAGYFPGGLAKIEAARGIATHMDPDRNRSRSFRAFREVVRELSA